MKRNVVIGVLLLLSPLAQAGKNYNYSSIDIIGGLYDLEVGDRRIDGKHYGAAARYEFSVVPIVIGGAVSKGDINSNELVNNAESKSFSYSVGAKFVWSPMERLDFLPGISIGRAEDTSGIGSSKIKLKSTYYRYGIDSRFDVYQGLWLSAGVGRDNYKNKLFSNRTSYKIGVDYKPADQWALGYERVWSSKQSTNNLFVRFFY